MSDFIGRREHEEMLKRMDEEHKRLGKRIEIVERKAEENAELIIAVHELTSTVKLMQEEMKEQGKRLKELESIPAKKWDKVSGALITGIISVVIGILVGALGF